MKKYLLLLLFVATAVLAKVDYSEMSNEELLALMGYVAPKNQSAFVEELNTRRPTFTPKEHKQYQRNLQHIKKMRKK